MRERPVSDSARGALLARLLGEEPHRHREQPQERVRRGEDLEAGRAGAGAPVAELLARERDVERRRRQDPARRAPRHHRADLLGRAARVVVDQLPRRHVERRLVATGRAHGSRHRPQPDGRPVAVEDRRDVRERLDVLDQRRPAEVAELRRKRRLQPRHPAAALHRLEHRRLLAADVCTGPDDHVQGQPLEEPGDAVLGDRALEAGPRRRVLLAQVDPAFGGIHRAHRQHRRLEQEVRPALHDVAVLDRPRLALVGVDHDDARPRLAQHRFPLQAGGEARTAVAGEARLLQRSDHTVRRRKLAEELEAPASLVVRERLVRGVESEVAGVRAVDGLRHDPVADRVDRRELAVTEARHLDDGSMLLQASEKVATAETVADRSGADADRVGSNLEERIERDDLVHLAAPDRHVVGERVRKLGREWADLPPDPTQVVEQACPLDRKLREEGREPKDVHVRDCPTSDPPEEARRSERRRGTRSPRGRCTPRGSGTPSAGPLRT